MTTVEEILAHHGIKGMRWGVEKSRDSSASETHIISESTGERHPAPTHTEDGTKIKYIHEHAVGKAETDRIVKAHGIQAVSNYQLRSANERSNLENQYKQMNPTVTTKGKKFAGELVKDIGKQEARKAIAKSLAKKAAVAAVV